MSNIGKRIAQAREHAGMNQSELARALNVKPQAVQKWEAGGSPKHARLTEIAMALNVSVGYLIGDDATEPQPRTTQAGLAVPLLSNAASMGYGADTIADDVIADTMTLTPQFVHEHVRPSKESALRFIHAYGDSMEPTLKSGDVLLVDTGIKDVKIDGIYVLRAHNRLFVKRVRQRMDGKFEISSDNPTHKTVDILNGDYEVAVMGRVVWYWNGHKM